MPVNNICGFACIKSILLRNSVLSLLGALYIFSLLICAWALPSLLLQPSFMADQFW